MKKKVLILGLVASVLATPGCVNDKIDGLQQQIDDLNSKVGELEKSQQEALLNAMAAMEVKMAALSSERDADYEQIMEQMRLMQEEVANNSDAIYYGNLLTDADYEAFATQGATILTGKAVLKSADQYQKIAAAKLVGGDLLISGLAEVDFEMLQTVGGHLSVSAFQDGGKVTFSKLTSVGGDMVIAEGAGLTAVDAPELVLINGGLTSEMNDALTSLTLPSLDQVSDVLVDGYLEDDPTYLHLGVLSALDLGGAHVTDNVAVSYVSGGELVLGTVGGSFECVMTGLTTISSATTMLEGGLVLDRNFAVETVDFESLEKLYGELNISSNDNSYDWEATESTGLSELPAFSALTEIHGSVIINNNGNMTEAIGLNAVTTFVGEKISISTSGPKTLDVISVFNELTEVKASTYGFADVEVFAYASWFKSFSKLERTNDLRLALKAVQLGGGISSVQNTANVRLDGFEALNTVRYLNLDAGDVTEFNALGSLDRFLSYGDYLYLTMPKDENVGLCSMEPIFNKINNGDFEGGNKKATFSFNWANMETQEAITQLLTPCND
ncbi:hypothetical protein [Persicobacter psychrovividus]|uniref:Receptor L-domain domain-containing protein n=1 Tax=Persicobacter psychrovividus TaxID=387638 RepID=A0ABN6LCD5_9BACT|nr:hypothetical protein PEPS_31240 [Persicobacter psychrovividus]